jgi:Zn-dependent protease
LQLPELVVPAIIVVAIMLLIGFPVHEFAHALAAFRLGDGTAKLFGRLTLDPRVHFDRVGGSILALTFIGSAATGGLFGFGWARPTPVNPLNLANGRYGEAIVAAAGPLSNLILAIAAAIPLRYLVANPSLIGQVPLVFDVLYLFVLINIVLMLFNFIPIPPLDGSKVLFAFLDRRTEYQLRPILEQYGFFVILILFFFPPGGSIGGRILFPIIDGIVSFLVGF